MDALSEKREFLKQRVQELLPAAGMLQTSIDGFRASLRTAPTVNQHCFYNPMAIVVLQGKKQTVLGSESFTCDENSLVVTSIDIPTVGSIVEASPEKPFMTLILDLNRQIAKDLPVIGDEGKDIETSRRGMGIAQADEALLDAFCRLIVLAGQPERQKVLAPMIVKEIHYLLLLSPLGGILQSIYIRSSRNNKIAEAIEWLKGNFRAPLKVDDLAKRVNMAESSFYRHFSKVTSLSPLQYQKQLRLYEARRLMLSENLDAANAAYAVGYESASQFNREYKRMFGAPPKTNVNRIRGS